MSRKLIMAESRIRACCGALGGFIVFGPWGLRERLTWQSPGPKRTRPVGRAGRVAPEPVADPAPPHQAKHNANDDSTANRAAVNVVLVHDLHGLGLQNAVTVW